MVSEKLVKKFQKIIKEEYGKEVSMREASEIANGLVGYFDLLAKMYHEQKSENNKDG